MNFARAFLRKATWTRPANATPYTAGDGMADDATTATAATFTLKGMGKVAGMGGIIQSITLHKTTQNQVGADFDIYFFTSQPAGTTYEDNAAIAITDAVFQTCVGFVELTASADGRNVVSGDLFCKSNINLPYETAGDDTSLYFVVVARGAYTPGNAEVFTLTVGAVIQ